MAKLLVIPDAGLESSVSEAEWPPRGFQTGGISGFPYTLNGAVKEAEACGAVAQPAGLDDLEVPNLQATEQFGVRIEPAGQSELDQQQAEQFGYRCAFAAQ